MENKGKGIILKFMSKPFYFMLQNWSLNLTVYFEMLHLYTNFPHKG